MLLLEKIKISYYLEGKNMDRTIDQELDETIKKSLENIEKLIYILNGLRNHIMDYEKFKNLPQIKNSNSRKEYIKNVIQDINSIIEDFINWDITRRIFKATCSHPTYNVMNDLIIDIPELSQNFVKHFGDLMDWDDIIKVCTIYEEFVEMFADRIDWNVLYEYYGNVFDKEFFEKHKDRLNTKTKDI